LATTASRSTLDALTQLGERARATADSTRALIDNHAGDADPATAVALALSLAEVCGALRALLGPPLAREPERAADACELITELTELQQDLREHMIGLRFRALARIHEGLARLRQLSTVTELLNQAPQELCRCCDFDRASIGRVKGSSWRPEVLCIGAGQDPKVAGTLTEYMNDVEIPLTPGLLETELARRGVPALITDPANDPRTYKELIDVSQTRAYVAAPIMPTGRVIGFLHADCFGSGRELTPLDRDNLWTYAEGFGLIFERMVVLERLEEQRARVREAFRSAERNIDALCDAEIRLARQEPGSHAVASTAAGMFMPAESRVDALLTAREREVLRLMVSGARNGQIADQLVITEGTVKSHVKNICRKLRAANRAEAVSKYLQLKLRDRA
jgi:LuxR family transcriptional regulator, regulator of acetate metabolism